MTSAARSSSGVPGAFVAVDWGTSSFRGWLMSADGEALAESRGVEGMLHCSGTGFAPVLRDHLAKLGAPDGIPVLICGMAGARQGWAEAPYLKTPTRLDALHEGAIRVGARSDIRILPGIAQARADRPDAMRGEETQHLGPAVPRGPCNGTGCAGGINRVAFSAACRATSGLRAAHRWCGAAVGPFDRNRDRGCGRPTRSSAITAADRSRQPWPTLRSRAERTRFRRDSGRCR